MPYSVRPRRSPGRHLALLLCGVLLCACSLVTDLEDYEEQAGDMGDAGDGDAGDGDAGDGDADDVDAGDGDGEPDLGCDNPATLCVQVQNFTPHRTDRVVFDLVNIESRLLRARAILEPLADGGAQASIVMPLAIPESEIPAPGEDHPLQVEINADQNNNLSYDPPSDDHNWQIELPASGNLTFEHNAVFVPLEPRPIGIGGDFVLRASGMSDYVGEMFEVMVIEPDSGRAVGMFRLQSIPGAEFELSVPGVVDPGGLEYTLEIYVDRSGDRTYDDPPADHAWVKTAISNDDGIDFSFQPDDDFSQLSYQFDFSL